MKGKTLREVSPPATMAHPKAIDPELVIHHHRSAQVRQWGDRHGPLLHSYQHIEFHIHGKGILQSRNFCRIFFKIPENRIAVVMVAALSQIPDRMTIIPAV